jgi:hypothetical protein
MVRPPPPLVWVPLDHRALREDGHQMPYLVLGDKYAVQWHPKWRCTENPLYAAIFKAFGAACRARRNRIEGADDV